MSCTKTSFSAIVLTTIIYLCKANDFWANFPEKCGISDGECQKNELNWLFDTYADTGIEELGIPQVNPYMVNKTTVSVLSMVDFILTDGLVEGATNCSLLKFETNIDKRYVSSESFCDSIKISGHYTTVLGPLAQSLIGNTMSADGNGEIQIDKMTLKLKMPFEVLKQEDGEIYLIPKVKRAEYSTENIENIRFNADGVILGGRDISEQLMRFMNTNWRMINTSFGKFFSDKVMETFYYYLMTFFPMVPASKYISDDLTPYVKS